MRVYLLFALASLHGIILAQNIWTQRAPYPGSNTTTATTFTIGNKAYAFNRLGSVNTLWEYDPMSNTWTEKAGLNIVQMDRAVSFSIGDIGYVGTGNSGSGNQTNMFFAYDPASNTWTQKASMPGSGRSGGIGFSLGDKGYIGTGWSSDTYLNSFYEYDPIADSWTQKASFPQVRSDAGVFTANGQGYVFCGRMSDQNYTNTMWSYDPTTDVWIQRSNFPGAPRIRAVGFSINDHGFAGTGHDGSNANADFYEYLTASDTWTARADFGGGDRHWATSFSLNGKGYIGLGLFASSLYEYTPADITTSAGGLEEESHVHVYPNPGAGRMNIQFDRLSTNGQLDISVYDPQGKLVLRSTIPSAPKIEVDMSQLQDGAYFLVIQGDHGNMQHKVILQR